MDPIRCAISIHQPWAELILCGKKAEDFRRRRTHIRERVYIYASLRRERRSAIWLQVDQDRDEIPTGVIVGSVEIVDCIWNEDRKLNAYVLRNPERLTSPLHPTNHPLPGIWRPEF